MVNRGQRMAGECLTFTSDFTYNFACHIRLGVIICIEENMGYCYSEFEDLRPTKMLHDRSTFRVGGQKTPRLLACVNRLRRSKSVMILPQRFLYTIT